LKTSWQRFSKVSIAVVGAAILLTAAGRTFGSGGGGCDDLDCSSFFSPEIIKSPQETPFFLSDHWFYPRFDYSARPVTAQETPLSELDSMNLDEWSSYLAGSIPKKELRALLYETPGKDLPSAMVKYGKTGRLATTLEYLQLAKQVQPIATRNADDNWQARATPESVDPAQVKKLMETAENGARKSDKFLAQRYRFQVIRLLFYSGEFPAVQQYYEQFKAGFTEENSPKYRFMDTAAGAYYKDRKYGQADYLYSIIFDRFAPLKQSAYFSFHPMEDADWNETLALAKNTREREVLWQLLGIYADGVAAIDKIYSMDPKSKLLQLLVVREVNRAERDWTGNQSASGDRDPGAEQPSPETAGVGAARLAKIRSIADAGNTDKPFLWNLAAGHLLALAGDSRAAETYINKAVRSMPNDPALQTQARMSLLFARVRTIQAIDRLQEPFLAQELTWLGNLPVENTRSPYLNDWALHDLSQVYLKGGDTIRSLMLNDFAESDQYRTLPGLDALLAFMRNSSTPFDRFLVKNHRYQEEQIQELRALQFLYAGDFSNAIDNLKIAGDQVKKDLNADPFTIHIKDCHDCDAEAPHTHYTKLSFAERMLSLSRAAQGRGEAAAAASFDLANGFYNMSYYGNGRDIYETAHDNLDPRFMGKRDGELALNMNLAQKYYMQAFNLSSNREFKARAAFMAAKTEQNRYYNTRKNETDPQPQTYFKMLKDSFANTAYYQEIIRECGTFRSYLGR
jgi:hypothetical protein